MIISPIRSFFFSTLVLIISTCGLAKLAHSSDTCHAGIASEILSNFCLLENLQRGGRSLNELITISRRLSLIGYKHQFGELSIPVSKYLRVTNLTPTFEFSPNTNGGNPKGTLVLGDIQLSGDKSRTKREGILLGMRVRDQGRFLTGHSSFINHDTNINFSFSPEHGDRQFSLASEICGIHHAGNWWYWETCLNGQKSYKVLQTTNQSSFRLKSSKTFQGYGNIYHQFSYGLNRIQMNDYMQHQTNVSVETIHSKMLHSELKFTLGEPIRGALALQTAIDGSLSISSRYRPITLSARYERQEGGELFGLIRNDQVTRFGLSFPIRNNARVGIFRHKVKSSLSYFSEISTAIQVSIFN